MWSVPSRSTPQTHKSDFSSSDTNEKLSKIQPSLEGDVVHKVVGAARYMHDHPFQLGPQLDAAAEARVSGFAADELGGGGEEGGGGSLKLKKHPDTISVS